MLYSDFQLTPSCPDKKMQIFLYDILIFKLSKGNILVWKKYPEHRTWKSFVLANLTQKLYNFFPPIRKSIYAFCFPSKTVGNCIKFLFVMSMLVIHMQDSQKRELTYQENRHCFEFSTCFFQWFTCFVTKAVVKSHF